MHVSNTARDLLRAVSFAADKHRDQRRKGIDASPYINHPIEVAELISQVGDVVDGCRGANEKLERYFDETPARAAEASFIDPRLTNTG